jgi:hypothetical protein
MESGKDATDDAPEEPSFSFELRVRPGTGPRGWHATLRREDGGEVVEFDAPTDLLRYLANFQLRALPGTGLR